MKDTNDINREREGRANLSQYKELIETISKMEYKKFASLGLIELSEVIALSNYTVYYVIINKSANNEEYNTAYLTKAIKWAVRNEIRRRYKWYVKKDDIEEKERIKDAVYKTILSIDDLENAENPTQIKDYRRTPDEKAEVGDLKKRICEAMKNLSPREQDLIKAKYFYDKKLKDIAVEFNISQSRISRIIQCALDKVKEELLKQEKLDEDNISKDEWS